MPRRNRNAAERTETRWNPDYIRSLMRKLRAGALEQAYAAPDIPKTERSKEKRK